MATLTLTVETPIPEAEVFRHLGVSPGDRLLLTLLPTGRAELTPAAEHAPPATAWDDFIASVPNRTGVRLDDAQLDAAIADAVAAARGPR